jgi:hypothetical protein
MENYNDPAIVALARKVKLIGEKDRKVPKIAVTLHNGKSYDIEEEKEWGTLTPTDEKVRAKFSELATDFLGERKAKEVIDIVMSLEKVDNIKELTRRLASK